MTKKERKPDRREYTLMLVPHHGQTVRSIRIPIAALKCTVSFLLLLIVFLMGSFVHYRYIANSAIAEKEELEALRRDTGIQGKEIDELAKTATALKSDMERLNSLDAEIRRIINTDEVTATSRGGLVRPSGIYTGQGGPTEESDLSAIRNTIQDLQSTITVREQSLNELKQALLDKQLRLAATPSIWPTGGEVTSRFGWRSSPFGGRSDFHPGIDIANSLGSPVVATADGEVVQSEWYGGYGNMVQINHGNGIATVYGHNSRLAVHVGQKVKKGEVIAYLGNTGASTGPHCHYEVRINGKAVNPANFLN